jgi:hypothetical protein
MINELSEIVSGLYIGNEKNSQTIGGNFDLVVNCTPFTPFAENCKNGVRISVIDDLSDSFPLFQILRDSLVLQDIHEMLKNRKRVLVHCQAGAQRSPAVVACYFIKYHNMTPTMAIEFVKSKRQIAFLWFVNFQKTLDLMYKHVNQE